MNIFRWSVDNNCFSLYEKIDPTGNVYLEREGIWGDELAATLRKHGFRIYMVFFGFNPPYPDEAEDQAKMDAIKRYVKYVADRYGAYVDFWELMNEFPGSRDKIDDDWYKQVASYLGSVDPYKHPISTNWERPDIAEIDICSPHWYERENEFDSDFLTWCKFEDWKRAGKPVIVGEQGNQHANWDERSGIRMRIRTWTTFFVEGALIFWNTTFAKDYRNDCAANVYLGPEERGYLKVLNEFTRDFDPRAVVAKVEVSPKTKVRAYALGGPEAYAVYLCNYVDHTNPTGGAEVKIEPKFAGTATWIEPATGRVLKTEKLPSGSQTVKAPDFLIDAALKVVP